MSGTSGKPWCGIPKRMKWKSRFFPKRFGSVVNRRPEIVLSVMASLCHGQASNPL
jgi:hypothetical protein